MNPASYIEHTNLNDDATNEDIKKLCEEALEYKFYGVCIYPQFVKYAKSIIKNKCKVITVINFPLGNSLTEEKAKEAKRAIKDGADELDMVINKEALKDNKDDYVKSDIKAVVEAAEKRPVKVIIEARELNEEQKKRATKLIMEAGASFVKTSTGKSPAGGATVEDVKLIKSIVGNKLGIKAAGGISDNKKAIDMIDAGATRIGASKSINIIWCSYKKEKHPYEELKYAFEWFKYHANQRYTAFYYYLLIIGALLLAYLHTSSNSLAKYNPIVCMLAIISSMAFYLLEYRNEELVNYGRKGLEKMEELLGINIRLNDKNRGKEKPWMYLLSHGFVVRTIFIVIIITFIWLLNYQQFKYFVNVYIFNQFKCWSSILLFFLHVFFVGKKIYRYSK